MGHDCRGKPWTLSFRRLPLALAVGVLLLDQATKLLVHCSWGVGTQRVVIPGFFHLVHFRNPGAAWGLMGRHTLLLAVLSAVVLAGLVMAFGRLTEGFPERALALGVIAGGIAGNLVDRLVHREVIDFLLFYYRQVHWPAFNVADSAISCGVAAFILSSFFRHSPQDAHGDDNRRPQPQPGPDGNRRCPHEKT
ncbi:MAG: signal peptidase II [Lentisphaeria bacterium]|nr:signal peptidase II [Lentisphaeria bacterium]